MSVTLQRDKKSSTWIITRRDKEGFHRQLNLTEKELVELSNIIENELNGLHNKGVT